MWGRMFGRHRRIKRNVVRSSISLSPSRIAAGFDDSKTTLERTVELKEESQLKVDLP